MDDYRKTKYCLSFENINLNKNKFLEDLKLEFPEIEDIYSKISKNDDLYKIKFMKIYNYRCSYCGVSLNVLNKRMFEIDHYIYRKSPKFKDNNEADKIENLVLSCQYCNRKKRDFYIPDTEYILLYPDGEEIKKVFYRDEQYYIRISNNYLPNQTINKFYKKLKLDAEVRRLDFLLINLLKFKEIYKNKLEDLYIFNDVCSIIEKLKNKRNII